MSASLEELESSLECQVEAMYIDLILTGHMTKDELMERISVLLDNLI